MKLIILAAGMGTRLQPLTENKPKCLAPLLNKPLLEWQIQTAHAAGLQDIIVVGGYQSQQLANYPVTLVKNELFSSTNMVYSLFCAREYFGEQMIVSYGDIVYEASVLKKLMHSKHPITVTIDTMWRSYWQLRFAEPLNDAESLELFADGTIKSIGQKVKDINQIQGQYIGLCFYQKEGIEKLIKAYDEMIENQSPTQATFYMTDLLQKMINQNTPVHSLPIERGWYEIDTLHDLTVAEKLLQTEPFQAEDVYE